MPEIKTQSQLEGTKSVFLGGKFIRWLTGCSLPGTFPVLALRVLCPRNSLNSQQTILYPLTAICVRFEAEIWAHKSRKCKRIEVCIVIIRAVHSSMLVNINKWLPCDGGCRCVVLTDFHGLNTPTMANVKLPTCGHWMWVEDTGQQCILTEHFYFMDTTDTSNLRHTGNGKLKKYSKEMVWVFTDFKFMEFNFFYVCP